MDHNERPRRGFCVYVGLHGPARLIHKHCRRNDGHLRRKLSRIGKGFYHHSPGVVPGMFVLIPWISKSHNETHTLITVAYRKKRALLSADRRVRRTTSAQKIDFTVRARTIHGMHSSVRDKFIDDLVRFALIALLIVIPVRVFIAQPFIVRGASMEPTFRNGEYLIVDQLTYRLAEPKRGDVIILRYPKDERVFFIKRVIGLPGETVEIIGDTIVVQKEGSPSLTLDQSFIEPERLQSEFGVYVLDNDEYFVMGDNRRESSDSRSWGPLPQENIVGRALVRLFPPTELDLLPGTVEQK